MAEEQELTPEEKLLEVIQKGDVNLPVTASNASGESNIGSEQDASPISKSGAPSAGPLRLSTINKILVLVALACVGFSGYEIYGNLPQEEVVFDKSELNLSGDEQADMLASLSDTLDMFDGVRITGIPPDPTPPGDPDFDPEALKGWRAYVRDNFKILATSTVMKQMADGSKKSVLEAIVMDTKEKKMQFLQVGDIITVLEQKVSVEEISDKTVELACEEELQIIGDKVKN